MRKKILAVIPARGGSKGIPRKNIKDLAGKPLIAWTIETAKVSSVFDRIIVSTDDQEIADIARQFGADVPFLRPQELSTDTATSIDVVLHLIQWLRENERYSTDYLMLLQPTSPFRSPEDITQVIQLMQSNQEADAIISVTAVDHPVQWLRKMEANGKLLPLDETPLKLRRQDAQQIYQLNGSIYLIKTETFVKDKTFLPAKTFGYIMPEEKSIDIDTPWNFHMAELIMRDKNDR
mgnify:CR=1 FL=1